MVINKNVGNIKLSPSTKIRRTFYCVNKCLLLPWPWDLLVLGKSSPPTHADLSASLAAVLQHLALSSDHRTIYISDSLQNGGYVSSLLFLLSTLTS